MLHGPQSGGGSCRRADLAVDVLDVVICGLGRDGEPIGDLLRCESPGRESQHIDFASGKPARISRPFARGRSRLAVPRGHEHRPARARLEHALRFELAKLGRLSEQERRTVESVTAQILNKLLHLPTVRMKEAAVSADGAVYADAVKHLFGLDDERP